MGNDMLSPKSVYKKTYEELMEENLSKIPIYSDEWTNYNPSDPGITILENLSALQIIQQKQMDEIPNAVKAKLMQLLGYTARQSSGAKVYLEPQGLKEALHIPADQRYMVGNISFETTLARRMTASHIIGVYRKDEKGFCNCSHILEKDMTISALAFGKQPRQGNQIYIIMDTPLEPGEQGTVYIETSSPFVRNPFEEGQEELFSSLKWECYTVNGFTRMQVADETHGFLMDGYIQVTQPSEEAALYRDGEIEGYVWRATLERAEYDSAPVIKSMTGFLFPVIQKETLVMTHSFQKTTKVELDCAMLEYGYVHVFCKEQKGTSYRLYKESTGEQEQGRFYRKEKERHGKYTFSFDKQQFGYGPENVKNPLKIVVYNEEMMRKYYLGEVYGYDNQEMKLPKEHVVTETFSLIAERRLLDGSLIYDFLKPGKMGQKEFSYYLYENEGKIVILDAGEYIGAKLYIGSIAVNLGEEGNVIAKNRFIPEGGLDDVIYTNPAPGVGGCFQETIDDVRKRLAMDLNKPKTAVIPADYEEIVSQTPGLCIAKVKAWMDYTKNEVQIAVMPGISEKMPKLSECYLKEIERRIDDRRLLSTRVRVRQPVYSAVTTRGTIYVKPHYEGCLEQIEKVVREEIDYINGEKQFGQVLQFDRLFHRIEMLECVSYIDELAISLQGNTNAVMDGADIRPSENCLLYPGSIKLEILPSLAQN